MNATINDMKCEPTTENGFTTVVAKRCVPAALTKKYKILAQRAQDAQPDEEPQFQQLYNERSMQ
jgi:hypothetical protein